jgi:hypothetical protein
MLGEIPPVHKGVHNVHTSFGRTNRRCAHSAWRAENTYRRKNLEEIRVGHVVTTTTGHE